ncbi:MAG: CooT family nickel-binding protein [Nitrososphaerales archaeon]|nr:CooT family nickel-binding protein [Nitrososphaerales archaeon]
MCEFKVFSRRGEKEQEVAEDIVYAKASDKYVILRDILGLAIKIPGAVIDEVDVGSEILKLSASPIILKLNKFLKTCDRCKADRVYSDELEALWNEVKASGDEAVRELWKKYGRRKG